MGMATACEADVEADACIAGAQQADAVFTVLENTGMLSRVWNVSHAMPWGSVTQYLSDFE